MLIGLIALAGCATEPGEWLVRVDVVGESFASGARIPVDIVNSSDEEVHFGACPFSLQKRDGASWRTIPDSRACIAILLTLPPDQARRMEFLMLSGTEPGTYRLLYHFTSAAENRNLRASSQAFTVKAAN